MRRTKAFSITALVIGAIGVTGAPAASAAGAGSVDIACGTATYHYSGFGAGSHTVTETVDEQTANGDFIRLAQVPFTFTGDSADHAVGFHLDPGPHTVRAGSTGFEPARSLRVICEAPPDRWGDVHFTCGQATFHFDGFGDGTHTVQETVYEDTGGTTWTRLAQIEFTFTGPSADSIVAFDLASGTHTLRGDAWHYPSGGHIAGFVPPRPQQVQCDPPATPPTRSGDVDITCGQAAYHFDGFSDGTHTVQETIYEDTGGATWNRLEQVEFTFTGTSGRNVVDFDLPPGAHTIRGDAWNLPSGGQISGFGAVRPQDVQCGDPAPPTCPTGQITMRFQYSHGDKSGSGSASKPVSCPGPTTLQGSVSASGMRVLPGGRVDLGYSLTAPAGLKVSKAQLAFPVRCEKGSPSSSVWTVTLPSATYGAVVPNLCPAGGKVRLDRGATFSTTVG